MVQLPVDSHVENVPASGPTNAPVAIVNPPILKTPGEKPISR